MKYLVTGHTGFKGAWLSLWLSELGHEVHGLALDPLPGGIFERAAISEMLAGDIRQDIRDEASVDDIVRSVNPDVLIHLAAQPLVRQSYQDPRTTVTTNVIGTMNVLTAMSSAPALRAAVIVTTDKVYRNVNQIWGYREVDPLGGDDPYSASKAMADILTASWVNSFPGPPTAIARAGNVVGGGDVSPDRLLPDLIDAHTSERRPVLRYPSAVRPWQHVLDCLNGYLHLTDALLSGAGAGAWNFGPDRDSFRTVAEVNRVVAEQYGHRTEHDLSEHQPQEAGLLALDSSRAHSELGWRNRLRFDEAIAWTVDWERRVRAGADARAVSEEQIRDF